MRLFSSCIGYYSSNEKQKKEYTSKYGAIESINATSQDDGSTPLILAIKDANLKALKFFIKEGADVNISNNNGSTALMFALQNEKDFKAFDAVQMLVQNGAQINTTNKFGETALLFAVANNHQKSVKLLIKKGADVNLTDVEDRSPLYFSNTKEMTKILIKRNAMDLKNIDKKYIDDKTQLFIAAENNEFQKAKLLIQSGANINISNNRGVTPLIQVSDYKNQDFASMLIENGADINAQNSSGCTALWYAAQKGLISTVHNLLEHDADPNIANNSGNTPVGISASRGFLRTTELLLDYGADPNIHNNDAYLPLDFESVRNNRRIHNLLHSHDAHNSERFIDECTMDQHARLYRNQFNMLPPPELQAQLGYHPYCNQ